MDEDALIKEILEHPELDEPRMVYADWLEERGDRRAEFLRLESEFNKFEFEHSAVGELKSELSDRFNALTDEHQSWLDTVATRYHVWYLSGNFAKIELVKLIRAITGFSLEDSVRQANSEIPNRILANLDFPKAESICQMIAKAKWLFPKKSKLIVILPTWREPTELKSTSNTKNDSTVPKS